MKGLQKLMISLGLDLSEWGDGITRARNEFKVLEKGITTGLKKIGVGAVMVAGSMVGLFGMGELMAAHSRSFEDLQHKVHATDTEMVSLKEDVYGLNSALGLRSVSAAADKFSMVARMSRATGDELERLTYQTGLLGKMFGEEEEQLGAQVAVMKAFKTSAGEAGDVVAYLNKQGGDIKGELLESIKEYSVQFAEAGFSLDQSVGILKAGLTEGWNVDKAADAFKEGRLRLMGGDRAAVDALGLLGLGDLDNQIKSGLVSIPDAMAKIQSELGQLNKTEQFRIAKDIFGTQYEDVGSQAMTAMLEGMRKEVHYTGAIDQLGDSLNNRFSHKWDQGISNMTNSFSRMLESLKPHVLPMVERLTELTESISEFSNKYEYITKTIGIGIPAFAGLALALGGLKIAAGLLKIALTALTIPFTKILVPVLAIGVGLYYLEKKTGIISKKWEELKVLTKEIGDQFELLKKDIGELYSEFNKLSDATSGFQWLWEGLGNMFDVLIVQPIKRTLIWLKGFLKVLRAIAGFFKDGFTKENISLFGEGLYDVWIKPITLGYDTDLDKALLDPRNTWFGKMLGISDEDYQRSNARSIREGDSKIYLGQGGYDVSGYLKQSTPLKQPGGQVQKTGPTYQININGGYHSNSRNAAADWSELVVTAE